MGFKELLDQVKKYSPDVIEDLKTFARHPRSVGALLESRSAWLNRKFLGAASNFIEPFLVGMGLSVACLNEDSVEVTMPGFLRNQGEMGVVHNAALSAMAEFAARLFWEHHLDLRRSELFARSISFRALARAAGPMRAVFRLSVSEREAAMHRLRADGNASVESTVSITTAPAVWSLKLKSAGTSQNNSRSQEELKGELRNFGAFSGPRIFI